MEYKILLIIAALTGTVFAIAAPVEDFQSRIMNLSGLNASSPQLETTEQRNQFFDNYSVLSIPDVQTIDQIQLQSIQTFAPSHRRVSLEGLDKIKDITSGLAKQSITVTPEDFKDLKIQNGEITIPNMASQDQQVKDIISAANAVMQEVKSLNQKELTSLKLTISDIRSLQKVAPLIQQQLNQANEISLDTNAMNAEMTSARKEMGTLIPNLTFADFDQLANASTSSSGKLILPNYNKETASDNLNKFVEISNQGSKYIKAGVSLSAISVPPAFQMKGVDTITGQQNGFLNFTPGLSGISSVFTGSSLTQNPSLASTRPTLNWGGGGSGPLLTTMTNANTIDGSAGAQVVSSGLFQYMDQTTFATFASFEDKTLNLSLNSNPNSFLSITMTDAINAFCVTGSVCRDKLSYGDLQGFLDEIVKSVPEGVAITN